MARYNNYSIFDYLSFPLHLCLLVFTVFFIVGFTWYINYENKLEDLIIQFKLFCLFLPLLLLLLVHCMSSGIPFLIPLPEKESLHRAGGSPWGVAALLVFLLFMISYQSSFQERWFPLLSR